MLIGKDGSNGTANKLPLAQNFDTAQPREIIYRAKQPSEHFYVICKGWAFRFHRLQNGRRHILSFFVAGDVVSNFSIFTGSSEFSIQALTEVRFCKFDRGQIRARLLQEPEIFEEWLARSVAMLRRVDRTGVALSRLQAHEKIAWLILQLRDRLDAKGMINGDAIEFPLRQSHIADAMGLTTVHVCRVINGLRKQGVFAIQDGVLRIFDLAALRRIANVM